MLVVLDKNTTFLLSGNGDLIEPDDGLVAIGSGGPFALAAARVGVPQWRGPQTPVGWENPAERYGR